MRKRKLCGGCVRGESCFRVVFAGQGQPCSKKVTEKWEKRLSATRSGGGGARIGTGNKFITCEDNIKAYKQRGLLETE